VTAHTTTPPALGELRVGALYEVRNGLGGVFPARLVCMKGGRGVFRVHMRPNVDGWDGFEFAADLPKDIVKLLQA
jgi:hypothetical protein